MTFTFIRGGLSDAYIESKLWESRDSRTSMDDITGMIAKCRLYKSPNFSLPLLGQPRNIIFKDQDEVDRFFKQYRPDDNNFYYSFSQDNLTMTI